MGGNNIDALVRAEIERLDDQTQLLDTPLPGFEQLISVDDSPSLEPGSVIGHWRICSPIGAGGMAQVYLVERIDGQLTQKLALKIVRERFHGDSVQTRFLRERQILANLSHNHIARFLDAGITESGLPWFVMEFIDGPNILDYCLEQKLPQERRIRLFRQVCEALAHAHSNNIIHRDIKPSNILVDPDLEMVKLLDFGIASESGGQSLTMTGLVIGTPGYMSPEQALGDQDILDERSDLFSLGVLLYQMIGEKKPFTGKNFSEISYKIIHKEPERLAASVPSDLQAIIFQCVEKDRADRYASVNLLVNDLDSFLQHKPVAARPITGVHRLYRLVKRNRMISGAIGFALVVLVFAGLFSSYQSLNALQTIRASEQLSYESQKLVNEVRRVHMMPSHDVNKDYDRVRQQLQTLEQTTLHSAHANQGQGNAAVGAVYLALGDFVSARLFLERSMSQGWNTPQSTYDFGLTMLSLWSVERASLRNIHDASIKKQRLAELKSTFYEPAITALNSVRGSVAQTDYLEAQLANIAGDFSRAIDFGERAIAANDWHYEAHLLISEALMRRLAQLKQSTENGDYIRDLNRAVKHVEQAQEIGRSDPKVYVSVCGNASAQAQAFRVLDLQEELKKVIEKSIDACTTAIRLYPESNSAYGNLAQILIASGDRMGFKEPGAMASYQRALAVLDQGAIIHPDSVRIMRDQTKALIRIAEYKRRHQMADIESQYDRALKIAEKVIAEDPAFDASWVELARVRYSKAGYLRDDLGEYQQAVALFLLAGENYLHANTLSKSVAKIMNYGFTLSALAETRFLQGAIGDSLDVFAKSIETHKSVLKNNRANLRHLLSTLELSNEILSFALEHGKDSGRFFEYSIQLSLTICQILDDGTESHPGFEELLGQLTSYDDNKANYGQCVQDYLVNHVDG